MSFYVFILEKRGLFHEGFPEMIPEELHKISVLTAK